MNFAHLMHSAVAACVAELTAGNQISLGILYMIGPVLFTIGTLLRRGLPPRGNAAKSQEVWTRTMQLDTSRKSVDSVAKARSQRHPANAM